MNGIEFYLRKRRMTARELAKRSGVHKMTISSYVNKTDETDMQVPVLLKISAVLDVPIDDLVKQYDENELLPGEHSTRKTFITGDTILNRFRKAHNLTYEELGVMLSNSTRQNAFGLCKREGISDTMLHRLCKFEGISEAEFLERYGEEASA
jgi:transcriptional regulator with XRE-family HTH domain